MSLDPRTIRAIVNRELRHTPSQAEVFLDLLTRGAGLVDPGNLTTDTQLELARRTRMGELECRIDHGRRLWRRR